MKFITKFIIKLFFEIYVNKIYLYVGNVISVSILEISLDILFLIYIFCNLNRVSYSR